MKERDVKMKKTAICLVHIGMVLLLLAAGFHWLEMLTMRKEAAARNTELYERGGEYDVLFAGNSHMVNGVLPMELYEEYGITSYNMGRYGHYIPESCYALEDALEYTSPRIVVIDTFMLGRSEKMRSDQTGINFSHTTMDSIPLSLRKIRAVLDLQQDGAYRKELLFPYSVYHNRWDELGAGDFQVEYSGEKGAITNRRVASYREDMAAEAENISLNIEDSSGTGTAYLDKMITMCRERGIAVVLVYLPFPLNASDEVLMADRIADRRLAAEFAEQNGLPFLDFIDTDLWNPYTDFADKEHMNALGAQKITKFLGAYLKERYELADRREDASYEAWQTDYTVYYENKKEALTEEDELDTYLMLCNDSDFSVSVVRNPGFMEQSFEKYDRNVIEELLQGLDEVSEGEETEGITIQVRDKGTGELIDEKTFVRETDISEKEE